MAVAIVVFFVASVDPGSDCVVVVSAVVSVVGVNGGIDGKRLRSQAMRRRAFRAEPRGGP